jgi:hypothetical protein
VAAQAAAARTVADLALVLRHLRRREARWRRGPGLTYQDIADRTGLSQASICGYLTGTRFAPADRFDLLVHALGAQPHELRPLATARDRVAEARRPDHASPVAAPVVPRMLPATVSGFTGRGTHLRELDALRAADAVVISAVAGMAGVGKTALAVHWANRVAADFPDGQLYVNLNGFGPGEPRSTVDALGVLLAGLGVQPSAVPVDEAGRAALYRTLLAGRRILVVIDNTDSADRVRPLLPPSPCFTVVTSRGDLVGLIAADGARRVTLDVMPADDATALLRLLIGPRADEEPDAVAALAQRCGHLPLALRVAAEQATFRPTVPISVLVDELDRESNWLSLHADTVVDERIDMRAVFNWSLKRLSGPAVHAFRLLGVDAAARALVRENPDIVAKGVLEAGAFDAYSLAGLLGTRPAQARRLVVTLARAHLVQPAGRDRYVMHDLLRDYAVVLARRDIGQAEREAAIVRALDYYLAAATAAVERQFPADRLAPSRRRAHAAVAPEFDSMDAAATWLTDNRENLVRACVLAARYGLEEHAVALALALAPFLDDGRYHDGLVVYSEALAAADKLGADTVDRAELHSRLGNAYWRLGSPDAAADHLKRAEALDPT